MPRWLGEWMYPISKTALAPLRLLHFLALLLCVTAFVREGVWLSRPLPAALRLMGRHSLEVFCFGVLLAPLADAINARADEHVVAQLVTGFAGAALMCGLAWLIEEYRRISARSTPAHDAVAPAPESTIAQ
jgi:hypothetical protein